MNSHSELHARLHFLARVVQRGCRHLQTTDQRLFKIPFTPERAQRLAEDAELAERVDAFVSRFGRLQDTLGDKLLPALLQALGEQTGPAVDNLDRAERLGWLGSSDDRAAVRRLRNQMTHEYIEDPAILASALQAGHEHVPMLVHTTTAMRAEIKKRGWVEDDN